MQDKLKLLGNLIFLFQETLANEKIYQHCLAIS